MKKIRPYSIGNQDKFNYYIFDKKQEVMITLADIFKNVFNTYLKFDEGYEDKNGEWKDKNINYKKRKDSHMNVSKDKNRIDIFFGDKKMFVNITCSPKLRQKFNKKLNKISKMPNVKCLK